VNNIIYIRSLFLFFVFCFYLPTSVFAKDIEVIINPNIEYKETIYKSFASDNEIISITTFQSETNKNVLRIRSKSNVSFSEQINIVSIILGKILEKESNCKFQTLFIGRLISAFGKQNTQMSERLAIATYESDLWDYIKGRPVTGQTNITIKKISNQLHIFPELNKIFSKHGFTIQVSGVEKVLIDHSETIPFTKSLKQKGIKPYARLPYDCLMWFSISKPVKRISLGGGYYKIQNKIYWRWRQIKSPPEGKPVKYVEKTLPGADPETFVFLTERVEGVWGKDKNSIFFFHEKINGVDMNTWEPLDMGYSKDQNFVYNGIIKTDANPKTFKIPL
jgi:hypothetical protein